MRKTGEEGTRLQGLGKTQVDVCEGAALFGTQMGSACIRFPRPLQTRRTQASCQGADSSAAFVSEIP